MTTAPVLGIDDDPVAPPDDRLLNLGLPRERGPQLVPLSAKVGS